MKYFCCDDRRRTAVSEHGSLNGIDFLEVLGDRTDPFEEQERRLAVHFIKDLAPDQITIENVRIEGGERIPNVKVVSVDIGGDSPPLSPPVGMNVLIVEVDQPGDYSPYTLKIVHDASDPNSRQPDWLDPVLSSIVFSFKVQCEAKTDCEPECACPAEPLTSPNINYLAKDYASFRQLLLDRFSLLMPEWTERNPSDLGIALVELLAYVGDYLSYQQDAVATEAYLNTARKRISVRRHARLVDYFMHDGSNARTWIHLEVRDDLHGQVLHKAFNNTPTKLLTRCNALLQPDGTPQVIVNINSPRYELALAERPEVFELKDDVLLDSDHNEMYFYTWGSQECCLAKGSTAATLSSHFGNLHEGDMVLLEEAFGPGTGNKADADPAHRQVVRLTKVTLSEDPLGGRFESPAHDGSVPITEIEWDRADALTFPLCVSARSGTSYFEDVSVARGNIVLADHGITIEDERLRPLVPDANPVLTYVQGGECDRCDPAAAELTPGRFRPTLAQSPITQSAPYDRTLPASKAMVWKLRDCLPAIQLTSTGPTPGIWETRRDLLSSEGTALEFVVEVETDGAAYLRFGDNRFGLRPAADTEFSATYRVGNGLAGNIGAKSLLHIASRDPLLVSDLTDPTVLSVTNPLPAAGGRNLESIGEVRQSAPSAFRVQERAVTPEDYATMAERCDPDIQRAAGTFRWTGSWRTVFVSADRREGLEIDPQFEDNLRDCLERYRMAGHDLEVNGPIYVPLEIEMSICVSPDYFVTDVKAALEDIFTNKPAPDGRKGVFHPDNFTFGQTVYMSRFIAAAQRVDGVSSVEVTVFQRQNQFDQESFEKRRLELSRLEVARLDNDPNFPERGVFRLIMKGGR